MGARAVSLFQNSEMQIRSKSDDDLDGANLLKRSESSNKGFDQLEPEAIVYPFLIKPIDNNVIVLLLVVEDVFGHPRRSATRSTRASDILRLSVPAAARTALST
jgi:hypothetical protein